MSNGGSPYRPVYHASVQSDGHIVLEVVGEENFQQFINSNKDACNIELIVARAVNGDPTALMRRQGYYGDFTTMPKTFAEMLQTVNDARAYFDGLDVETRFKFGNDFNKFVASLDDVDTYKMLGLIKEVEKESESDES